MDDQKNSSRGTILAVLAGLVFLGFAATIGYLNYLRMDDLSDVTLPLGFWLIAFGGGGGMVSLFLLLGALGPRPGARPEQPRPLACNRPGKPRIAIAARRFCDQPPAHGVGSGGVAGQRRNTRRPLEVRACHPLRSNSGTRSSSAG